MLEKAVPKTEASKYDFKYYLDGQHGERKKGGFNFLSDFIKILKIGDEYIAIRPIEERQGWIQYKWKFWPEVPSRDRDVVADTSLTALK